MDANRSIDSCRYILTQVVGNTEEVGNSNNTSLESLTHTVKYNNSCHGILTCVVICTDSFCDMLTQAMININ